MHHLWVRLHYVGSIMQRRPEPKAASEPSLHSSSSSESNRGRPDASAPVHGGVRLGLLKFYFKLPVPLHATSLAAALACRGLLRGVSRFFERGLAISAAPAVDAERASWAAQMGPVTLL